jgi:hypothetical protein
MVELEISDHMKTYRQNRLDKGYTSTICVDPCIVDEIKYLWSKGIITYGCCCGHNKLQPMVNVDEKNIQKMLDMGYKIQFNNSRPNDKDTFTLKITGYDD